MSLYEIIKEGKKQGYDISEQDINFALLSMLINNNTEAYSITHKQILKPSKSITTTASNFYRTPKQTYLQEAIKPYFLEKVNKIQRDENVEIMLTGNDREKSITTSELRGYLVKMLENEKNTQNLFPIIKLLVDKFNLDESDEKNRHIIILPPKAKQICKYCNREV